jgi:hypothetical protein
MKTRNLFLLGILFAFIFVSSCKKDETEEPVVINESEVLVQYLESTNSPYGKDYVATDMPSIISASELKTLNTAGQAYIIDIRDAAILPMAILKMLLM